MSYRMHIAVVDTQRAQAIRVSSKEYYEGIQRDWPKVQDILFAACEKTFRIGHMAHNIIEAIEDDLKANNLMYDKRILKEKMSEVYHGIFEQDSDDCRDFTCFYQMVEKDMDAKEDYTLGRFDIPKDIGNPFFVNQDVQLLFEHYNPRVIRKDHLASIIEMWRKLIVENYKEILMDPTKELRWRGHLEAKIDRWEFPHAEPYNLDENSNEIIRAYDLEYRIFELVRLYKSIDWMRDTVVLYGW